MVTLVATLPLQNVHFGFKQRTFAVQPQRCSLKRHQRPKSIYVHASGHVPYTVHPCIGAVPWRGMGAGSQSVGGVRTQPGSVSAP